MDQKFDITQHFRRISVLDHGYVDLIDGTAVDPRLKIVNAARVSFLKESRSLSDRDIKLIAYLLEHGHHSPFRHSMYTFRIRAPLFVFRQLWKYQVGCAWHEDDDALHQSDAYHASPVSLLDTSWNEASGRYVTFEPEFYVPERMRARPSSVKQGCGDALERVMIDDRDASDALRDAFSAQYQLYVKLIEAGVANELARIVLPLSTYSECVWTLSLQSIMHFLSQRLSDDAQHETREYAHAVYMLLLPLFMRIESILCSM